MWPLAHLCSGRFPGTSVLWASDTLAHLGASLVIGVPWLFPEMCASYSFFSCLRMLWYLSLWARCSHVYGLRADLFGRWLKVKRTGTIFWLTRSANGVGERCTSFSLCVLCLCIRCSQACGTFIYRLLLVHFEMAARQRLYFCALGGFWERLPLKKVVFVIVGSHWAVMLCICSLHFCYLSVSCTLNWVLEIV